MGMAEGLFERPSTCRSSKMIAWTIPHPLRGSSLCTREPLDLVVLRWREPLVWCYTNFILLLKIDPYWYQYRMEYSDIILVHFNQYILWEQ